jgi:hypothetical protein
MHNEWKDMFKKWSIDRAALFYFVKANKLQKRVNTLR